MSDVDFEARVRYRRGMDVKALVVDLAADGFDPAAAEVAVERIKARLTSDDRRRGFTNLMFGALLLAIAIGALVWSVTSGGGVLVLTYGALLVGVGLIGIGVAQIGRAGTDSALARLGLNV